MLWLKKLQTNQNLNENLTGQKKNKLKSDGKALSSLKMQTKFVDGMDLNRYVWDKDELWLASINFLFRHLLVSNFVRLEDLVRR